MNLPLGPLSLTIPHDWWWELAIWLSSVLGLALLVYGLHPLKRWKYRAIPGPSPWWLLGNLPELIAKGQHTAYLDWQRQHGPVYKLWYGGKVAVVVSDPSLVRKIARKSAVRVGIVELEIGEEKRFNDYGILMSKGEAWRIMSNAWHPFFTKESLASYMELMIMSADNLAEVLGEAADGGLVVDMHRQFGALTLDVIGRTAFGVDFHTMKQPEPLPDAGSPTTAAAAITTTTSSSSSLAPLPQSSNSTCAPAATAAAGGAKGVSTPAEQLTHAITTIFRSFELANFWLGLVMLFPDLDQLVRLCANLLPTPKYRETLHARRTLRKVASELLEDYRRSIGTGAGAKQAAVADGKGVDPGSFMALLTRATDRNTGKPFPDDWVTQQAFVFIAAGFETTGNALAGCVYRLAANPDKEAKLLAEVDAFGRDRLIDADSLQAFPYTQAVWKEALRLHPPASVIGREAVQDYEVGGFCIPKGTEIHGNIYGMHYSPADWPNPEEFVPERFLPGAPEAQGCNLEAFMPFGDGARKCTGYSFANQEGVLTLVRLYQQVVFRLTPGQVPLKMQTVLTHGPAEGVHVTVHRRRR